MNKTEEKSCCLPCDLKKKCHVCKTPTLFVCSDCQINFSTSVYVCKDSQCHNAHESKCDLALKRELVEALKVEHQNAIEGNGNIFSEHMFHDCDDCALITRAKATL